MKNTNIHPIYFRSFVGTWKRTMKDGSPSNSDFFLKFNKNLTFEELVNPRGTVNGDVDEVSVEGDEHNPFSQEIVGSITLTKDNQQQIWSFALKAGPSIKNADMNISKMNVLELNCEHTREVYKVQTSISIWPGNFKKGKMMKS